MLATLMAGCVVTDTAFAQSQEQLPEGINPITSSPIKVETVMRTTFDIFVGNGKPGPYTLSWNHLTISRDEPVRVVVDGETLKPNEFSVDAKKGIISFTKPVKSTSVVRVSYFYNPRVSKRNSAVATAPMTVPLLRFGGSDVKVLALPKADGENTGFSAPLAFSTARNGSIGGGRMTSQFNYAGKDALAMQLGFNRGNAQNGIDASFYRADKKLVERFGGSLGYNDHARRYHLNARLTPANWFAASFVSNDNNDLKKDVQSQQNVLSFRLGGVGTAPTLAFSRVESISEAQNNGENSVTTDKVDLNARLTPSTSLAVTGARTIHDVKAERGDVNVEGGTITVTTASKDNVSNGTLSLNGETKTSAGAIEQVNGVTLRLQAAPTLVISASRRSQTVTPLNPDGTPGVASSNSAKSLQADLIPMPGAKVTGLVSSSATNDTEFTSAGVTAQFGMGKAIEVTTGMTNRATDKEGVDIPDTTTAQVALRPVKGVTVTGGMTWNPEHQGNISQAYNKQLAVQAKLGAWEVGTGYSLTTLNGLKDWDAEDPQFGSVSLSLGLRLSRYSHLRGSYSDSLRYRSANELPVHLTGFYTRVVDLGLTHTVGDAFNFSLGTTFSENRKNVNQPSDVRAAAKIGVRF
jgi:hypothetical protein